MSDTLLFLHVLSAFMLGTAVVMLTASVLGADIGSAAETVANRLWDISGAGTIGFGLWIVFREDIYDVTDGWILGALVLWAIAGALATLIRRSLAAEAAPAAGGAPDAGGGGGGAAAWPAQAVRLHWVHAAITVGFLVLMIWKPGA
jgi:hypothetical protein